MLSALYAIARPSVRLSVRWVDQPKTVEVKTMKFAPYGSPIPLVFVRQVSSWNSSGCPSNGGVKQWRGGENKPFSSFKDDRQRFL